MSRLFKKYKSVGLIAETWQRITKNKLAVISLFVLLLIFFVSIFAPVFTKYDYAKHDLTAMLETFSASHWFGTDNFGRDIYTRVLYGGRISLMIAVTVVIISSGIGCIVGALSGYFKAVDIIVMRVVDVLAAIPTLLLAIAMTASFGAGIRNMILALGVSFSPACIRIVRSSVLGVREQEYVEAAVSIGAGNFRIITRHVLLNALSPIIVQSTLNISRALISSSTLSFLGLGVQPPSPEWGAMLVTGRSYIQQYPHMVIIPGMAIFIASYALNLFGDGLRDALDPRLKD